MDIRLALASGIDFPIDGLQVVIHQPTIKEISYIGEEGFFIAAQHICLDKESVIKDESLLASTTNFQILMTIIQDESSKEIKEKVILLLNALFPKYRVILTPQSILLTREDIKEPIMIDDNNFDSLQLIVRRIFCLNSSLNGENTNYNPTKGKAQEIADKLMKARQKIAAEKGAPQGSILGRYISILTVGLQSMSLKDCLELTLFQLYDLIERYSLFVNWDIDIRSRLAGGKPDNKPDDWMKEIH